MFSEEFKSDIIFEVIINVIECLAAVLKLRKNT